MGRPAACHRIAERASAEIRILGLVVVKPGPHGTWLVGEPYRRQRNGHRSEELRRVSYLTDPTLALLAAVGRARGLCAGWEPPKGALAVLDAAAEATAASAAAGLADPGALVLAARQGAGMSQAGLARAAGCSRTTIRNTEAGHTRPNTSTVTRLLAACSHGEAT